MYLSFYKTIPQSTFRLIAPFTQGSLSPTHNIKEMPAQLPLRTCTGICYLYSAKNIVLLRLVFFAIVISADISHGVYCVTVYSYFKVKMRAA